MTFDAGAYKQTMKEEWGRAAQGWHRWIPEINDWLAGVTEEMLDQAAISIGSRVIDIAAGDGGQSVAAASRVGPSGEVVATDIAPEFVALAEAVAQRLELSQLTALVMDAESLTAPDNSFDAAICRLGMMYLPDVHQGLVEMKRVLRPGGRLSVIVFTTPEKAPFFSIPVRLIREKLGLPSPPPGQPGPFSLGSPGGLASRFEEAGFAGYEERVMDAPVRFASAAECVRWRREASGTMGQMVSHLGHEEQDAIWSEVTDALSQFESSDGFESPCELLICSAGAQP